ncbi:MAG TPA: COX15/CtaA family protein [Candidatus Nitrosopolaris sp.]|nr:COX15/CtaA family protein [Candidatus Nitrosopolaris sp.]
MLLKTLAIASLCSLFVLIFIGGYVSASGVGLTCPHWPLCPAGLVPSNEFIIEYFHRSVAATTALLVIVTMAFTLRSKLSPRGMKLSSMIASAAAIGQISLGGAVIVERLHATLVTTHLGLGLVMFSMTLITTMYAYKLPTKDMKEKNTIAGNKIGL